MKTEKYINDDGEFFCFGFPDWLIGKSGTFEAIEDIPGTNIVFKSRRAGAELFCEFEYRGFTFHVSEPYGDNSYYDVCCTEPNTEALEDVHRAFDTLVLPTPSGKVRVTLFALAIALIAALWIATKS